MTDHATYTERFRSVAGSLPGAGLPWLDRLRQAALDRFAVDGLPTAKVEEWKYTNLAALRAASFDPADQPADLPADDVERALAALPVDVARGPHVVMINGRVRTDATATGDDALSVMTLADALANQPDLVKGHLSDLDRLVENRLSGRDDTRPHSLVALNTAFAADGVVIHARRGAPAGRPIHIVQVAAPADRPTAAHVRNLIIADPGSRVTVVEWFVGTQATSYWTNAVTDIAVADDAAVDHVRYQNEAAETVHIHSTRVRLAKAARLNSFVLSLGGAVARNEIHVDVDGAHGECRLNGIYLARDRQRMDTLTRVNHRAAAGITHELYKGAVDDRARAAFQGKIHVAPGAVQTSAHQTNRNVLLSDRAQADSKPELEILTDDVKCSHGATVGDLDMQALFYLRARGIDEPDARRILIRAFVEEPIESVAAVDVRDGMRAGLDAWLAASGAAS